MAGRKNRNVSSNCRWEPAHNAIWTKSFRKLETSSTVYRYTCRLLSLSVICRAVSLPVDCWACQWYEDSVSLPVYYTVEPVSDKEKYEPTCRLLSLSVMLLENLERFVWNLSLDNLKMKSHWGNQHRGHLHIWSIELYWIFRICRGGREQTERRGERVRGRQTSRQDIFRQKELL